MTGIARTKTGWMLAAGVALLAVAPAAWDRAGESRAAPAATAPGTGKALTFDFDAAGRLVAFTNAAGKTARCAYDARGFLARIAVGARQVRFEHDAAGRRVRMDDPAGTTTYAYDAFGRPKRITFSRPIVRHVAYDYDPWGRVTRVAVLDAKGRTEYAVAFDHDILGRVISADDGGGAVRYEYRPTTGEVVRTLPGGVRTVFAYSALGILESVSHHAAGASAAPIARSTYTYDPSGREVRVAETAGRRTATTTYRVGADGLFRPVGADGAGPDAKAGPAEADFVRDGDGLIVARGAGKDAARLFCAPLGAGGAVVGETDSRGRLRRVFVAADRLSMEHSVNPGTTYYLERGAGSPYAALCHRARTGASAAASGAPAGWSVPRGCAPAPAIDGLRYGLDVANAAASLAGAQAELNALPCLRAAESVLRSPWLVRDPARIAAIGRNDHAAKDALGDVRRSLGAVAVAASFGQDLIGVMGPQGSVRDKVLQHVVLGHTSEFAARHVLAGEAPFVGEVIGLTYDLARGHGLGSAEAWEHITDTFFAGSILALTGDPVLARIAADVPDLPRALTRPAFEAGGRWWGRTGSARAGGWIWQAAMAARCGGTEKFQAIYGEYTLTKTLRTVNPWARQVVRRFEDAVARGDRAEMADLLARSGHLRQWAHAAGVKDADLGQVIADLRSPTSFEAIPGPDLDRAERRLGGIALTRAATMTGSLGRIVGAVWDPASGRLVLLGDGDPALPGLRAEYLAAALLCVYAPDARDPSFSLDPADPKDPNGPWMRAKYYMPRAIRRTDFARVMYEADWLLKQYCFGRQVKYGEWLAKGWKVNKTEGVGVEQYVSGKARKFTLVDRRCRVKGFRDILDIGLARPAGQGAGAGVRARMWIESDKMPLRRAGNAFRFDGVTMVVKAKRQARGADGRLADVEADDPVSKEFARRFTRLYDAMAQECPAFAEVRELAKAIAVAKWLKEKRVPVDLAWARAAIARPVDVVDRVTTVTARRTVIKKMGALIQKRIAMVFGGVKLKVEPTRLPDNGQAARLEKAVLPALAKTAKPAFAVTDARQVLRATVLPVTKAGRAMWRAAPSVRRGGVTYRFNAAGKCASAAGAFGSRADFTWSDAGRLNKITYTSRDRSKMTAARTADGMRIDVRSPAGGTVGCDVNRAGQVTRVRVDGAVYADCTRDAARRTVTVRYAGGAFAAKTTRDQAGRLAAYARTRRAGGKDRTETVRFAHHADGSVTVTGDGVGKVTIARAGAQSSVTTDRGTWTHRRDAKGRLVDARGPEKANLQVTYAADAVTRIAAGVRGGNVRVHVDSGRVRRIEGPGRSATDVHYDAKGNVERVVAAGRTTRYTRDAVGRLTKVDVPGAYAANLVYGSPTRRSRRPKQMRVALAATGGPKGPPDKDPAKLTAVKTPGPRGDKSPAPTVATITLAGRSCRVAIGQGKGVLWPELGAALTAPAAPSAEQVAGILDAWKDLRVGPGKGPVLLVHGPPGAAGACRLRAILAGAHPSRTFVVTTNASRARGNLKTLRPIRTGPDSNLEACLVRKTLKPIQLDVVTRGGGAGDWVNLNKAAGRIAQVGAASNVLLVVGDMNAALLGELDSAGRQGRLKGKAVIIWACGRQALQAKAMDLIEKHGASMIWAPARVVDARMVPVLTRALNRVMEKAPQTRATGLMDAVAREAIRQAEARKDTKLIRQLKALLEGVLRSRRDGMEQSDVAA